MHTIHAIDEQPIIAQCTPNGPGAIALLRLSGTGVFELADHFARLPDHKLISELPSHTIHYGGIVDTKGQIVDQVLFLIMHAPRTFTGQDTLEITCHNNPFIVQAIIAAALAAGARLAREGEFCKRAVLNNKMDLLQAESINELIHAPTQEALKRSLAQLKGSLSAQIVQIERQLITALALVNASFEFIDEDIDFADQVRAIIEQVRSIIATMRRSFNDQVLLKEGVKIAFIGTVNAGKSSLFNALLGKNRAIVTPIAGTTRDIIEAGIYRNGTFCTLIDTAGLRLTDDIVEQQGIERSYEAAALADIILLIYDGSRQLEPSEQIVYDDLIARYAHKIITIINKVDLGMAHEKPDALQVSSHTLQGLSGLEQAIDQKIMILFSALDAPYLLTKRQLLLLQTVDSQLEALVTMLREPHPAHELIAIHITDSIASLAELSGRQVSEDAMNAIFREFCIGK